MYGIVVTDVRWGGYVVDVRGGQLGSGMGWDGMGSECTVNGRRMGAGVWSLG